MLEVTIDPFMNDTLNEIAKMKRTIKLLKDFAAAGIAVTLNAEETAKRVFGSNPNRRENTLADTSEKRKLQGKAKRARPIKS